MRRVWLNRKEIPFIHSFIKNQYKISLYFLYGTSNTCEYKSYINELFGYSIKLIYFIDYLLPLLRFDLKSEKTTIYYLLWFAFSLSSLPI